MAKHGPKDLPISVRTTAQKPPKSQRGTRYLPESTAQPAKMLPSIAARAIAEFTEPGDLVLDPMCGIGTTLMEAVYPGRNALGIEYEPRWAHLARANLAYAADLGATGTGKVVTGDARNLSVLTADSDLAGKVALLLTSPPYGASVHGRVRPSRDSGTAGVQKWDNRYSNDRANLAHRALPELLDGFTSILSDAMPLLKPGGIVAITVRSFRQRGRLIDLPDQVWVAAQQAGLEPLQRLVALLCGVRDDELIPRASFFQMTETRRARAAETPIHLVVHEDLLILRKSP